jgi:hypothetical protein
VVAALKQCPTHVRTLFGYGHLLHSRREYDAVRNPIFVFLSSLGG